MSQASPAAQQAARWRLVLNAAIVMAGTLLSRVLGVLREVIFARQFGASETFGAFAATFTIIDMLYLVIIGGALGSALIPVFGRLVQEDDRERAWQLANNVLTLALGAFVLVAAGVWVLARPLLALTVAQGYDRQLLDLAVRLLRIMLIQPLLLGLGGIMMALLQSFDRFTLPVVAFNVYNLAIIASALWIVPRFPTPAARVEALAWGVVCGALLYAMVQAPGVWRAGLRFRPSTDWRMPEVRRVAGLLAPRLVGQSALQINLIVMATLISLIGPEAQAANRYALLLLMLPHGLVAVSVGTVMFPRLSRMYAAGKLDELRDASSEALRLVLWLTVPVSTMLAGLHIPILRLLFQGGSFDENALRLTASVLLYYAPGAIGLAGAEIVIRTFYATEDTRTPVAIGIATIVLNAVLARQAIELTHDVRWLAVSYSFTNLLEFVLLWALLRWRLRGRPVAGAWRSGTAVVLGSAALSAVLLVSSAVFRNSLPGTSLMLPYNTASDWLPLALWLACTGVAAFGAYMLVSLVLRAPELREVVALVRRTKT